MVEYKILYSKFALNDAKKLVSANLDKKAKELIEIIKKDPFKNPPPYEKLVGNLNGSYSRRINIQHRLVYEVREDDKVIRISRMWSHYGE
ncbi:addiction module protein [Malaciobacter pacificus]|uniref:Putative mRNA interferase YoeB n=1 Tax=Malaciobacter pacificus TaxID=1080223 RepID=A0A5C2H725_9BACT|nr:Txe/YoeB family addiction module toxin [Malaciobacter pacificus]QEP34760.1 toxin-antitoxin system, toxin component, Txe/YoeB family [Malaciobacter pacificus]GGD47257.1 addiction module protein [Malaciobacter pacificus]